MLSQIGNEQIDELWEGLNLGGLLNDLQKENDELIKAKRIKVTLNFFSSFLPFQFSYSLFLTQLLSYSLFLTHFVLLLFFLLISPHFSLNFFSTLKIRIHFINIIK